MGKRRSYSREFKLEAVRLVLEGGASVAQVARDLGISENLLHSWKSKFKKEGQLRSSSKPTPDQKEIRRLRRELERVRQEREILKRATAYFAKESK
jgi:transposase